MIQDFGVGSIHPGASFPTIPITPIVTVTGPPLLQRITNGSVSFDVPRPNLLHNGGFEQWSLGDGPFSDDGDETADGWFVRANADGLTPFIQQEISSAPSGSVSAAKMTGTSDAANLIQQTIDPAVCALNGVTVSLSFMVKGPVGASVTGVVGVTGNVAFTPAIYQPCTGDWQTIRLTGAIPNMQPPAPVLVVLAGIGKYEFSFDNVALVIGETASDYQPAAYAFAADIPPAEPGPPGPPGPQGVAGLQGNPGARGSLWFQGQGLPIGIADAQPQDLYLDTLTGNIYAFS